MILKELNILITAVGGDIGSGIVRCLKDESDSINVIGCDVKKYVQTITLLSAFYQVPAVGDTSYLDEILKICEQHKVNIIIPTHENEILFLSKQKKIFDKLNIKLLVHSTEFLKIFNSKYETSKALKNIGLNVPETWYADNLPCDFAEPVIVKPDNASGSRSILRFDSVLDIPEKLKSKNNVVQKFIDGSNGEYTLCIFKDKAKTSYACFYRELGLGGMSVFVKSVQFDWLDDVVKTICDKLVFNGCINVQFRIESGTYYIFEINPRISSTVRFRYEMNFKDLIWWIKSTLDIEYDVNTIKAGLIGIKTTGELIFKD